MQKSLKKVGYLVHLQSEKDDSIDLNLKHSVLRAMLEEYKGLYVANYLSYKSNPLVAIYFIRQLHEEGIDTIAVHDPNIFNKEVIKLFINAGFHFILIEVNEVKTRFRINVYGIMKM